MENTYECGKLIKQIHDEIDKQANSTLASQNLTLTQMRVLMELESEINHCLSLKELEALLHVAQSTAAGIVVRLEQKGFVRSFESEKDKRIKMVVITDSGMECCEKAKLHVRDMETQLLKELNSEEKAEFHRLLVKICLGL